MNIKNLLKKDQTIIDTFLIKKLHLGPIRTGKHGFANFFFFHKDICKRCVSAWTLCQCSQRLRGHHVSLVNDYADTHEIILLWKK